MLFCYAWWLHPIKTFVSMEFPYKNAAKGRKRNNKINLPNKKLLHIVCIWTASLNWLNKHIGKSSSDVRVNWYIYWKIIQWCTGNLVHTLNPWRHHGWHRAVNFSKVVLPDALKMHSLALCVLRFLCKLFSKSYKFTLRESLLRE